MNKEKYISLKAEDVHKRLITDIALNLDEAPELLAELEVSEKYKNDHIFRASVETSKAYLLTHQGKVSEVIKKCGHLIEVAIILQEWELLSFDYNMVANSYFILGLYEKALEYYYSAINNEIEHGLKNTLPVSYANIGLIFLNVGLNEKALEYLRFALQHLEYADKDYFRFREKKAHILSDTMTATTKLDSPNAEEIERTYAELCSLDIEGIEPSVLYSYHLGFMYYYFWKNEYEKAKAEYIKARDLVLSHPTHKIAVLYSFIEECVKHKMNLDFFAAELLIAEEFATEGEPISEPVVYISLRNYYMSQGNYEKAEEVSKEYRLFLESDFEVSRKKQADSIQIIEKMLKLSKDTAAEQEKNREFKLVAEEALRNKNELQKTYNRIKMINEIGLKLISSTELNEVVNLIYKNIRENIPADAFIFMAAEPENNRLRSLLSYNMGVMGADLTISLTRKESALVKCCLTNKVVTTEDVDYKPLLEPIDEGDHPPDEDNMKSALFIPLSIGDNVIGAYSVQSRYEKAYRPESLDFLRALRPFLVIALNNAIHSKKLQNEIERNKEIQIKLQDANSMLSKMVGLDALTQISNRREFTEKFHELRKEAAKAGKTVSVFMFDIDDFKKYNDTYGHFEGDEALKKVATVINNNIISNGGIAARFGGEEFISACTGLTAEENVALGEKIRKEIYALGIENEKTASGILSISVGVAISMPGKIIIKSQIMSLADEMLYEAKKTGKNKVVMKVLE